MAAIEWLNYHHLYYFWTIAHAGSLTRAASELRLTHQTLSSQIRNLEVFLEGELFLRTGRALSLTLLGREVLEYADEIFRTGNELVEMVRGKRSPHRMALRVGVAGCIPKSIAYRLLAPALAAVERAPINLREGGMPELLGDLAAGSLHVVLSNVLPSQEAPPGLFAHLLDETSVVFRGTPELASKYAAGFPQCLNNAPFLMPATGSRLRILIDRWFATHGIKVQIGGEFDDYMMMAAFGRDGRGLFPALSLLADELAAVSGTCEVGELQGVSEEFYAIVSERRTRRTELRALLDHARHRGKTRN